MLVHGTLCNGNDRLPQGTIHVFTRPGYTVQYWVLTLTSCQKKRKGQKKIVLTPNNFLSGHNKITNKC